MLLLLKTYSPISLVFFKKKFELENKKLSLSVAKIIAVEFKYCFLLKAFNILSLPISSFILLFFANLYRVSMPFNVKFKPCPARGCIE